VAPIYATPADLAAWTGLFADDGVTGDPTKLPAGAVRALRSACKAVRKETITWFFPADPATGLAIDQGLASSMRTAALEQAEALLALEVDLTLGGTLEADVETSVKLGSASVAVAGAEKAAASRAATIVGLCPEARSTLHLAGMPSIAWVVG
jgi:hypothetical protein